MVTLPQELLDLIIDFAAPDIASLHNLCLASTSCLDRSRRHLFKSVFVVSTKNDSEFDRSLNFIAGRPDLRRHVRSLALRGTSQSLLGDRPIVTAHFLHTVLPQLENLTFLQLQYTRLESKEPEGSVCQQLPSLIHLALENVGSHADDPCNIPAFLGPFQHIHTLRLSSVITDHQRHDEITPSDVGLQALEIGFPMKSSACQVLRNAISPHAILSLRVAVRQQTNTHFGTVTRLDALELYEFLKATGSTLQDLYIDVGSDTGRYPTPSIDMSPCHSLRRFCFDISHAEVQDIPDIIYILMKLPPSVRHVVYRVDCAKLGVGGYIEVPPDFLAIINKLHYLESITFDLWDSIDESSPTALMWSKELKRRLPVLENGGLLHFKFSYGTFRHYEF